MLRTIVNLSRVALLICVISALSGCGGGGSENGGNPAAFTRTEAANVTIYNLVTTNTGTLPSLDVTYGRWPDISPVATTPYMGQNAKGTVRWTNLDTDVNLQFAPSGSDSLMFVDTMVLEPEEKTLCVVGQVDSLTDLFCLAVMRGPLGPGLPGLSRDSL